MSTLGQRGGDEGEHVGDGGTVPPCAILLGERHERSVGSGASKPLGPYQLQAAIAAVHDEAPTAQDIDWPQIVELYRLLEAMAPGPTVTLNRAVAEAMMHGPRAGLDLLATVAVDNRVSGAQVRRCASPPSRDGRRALRGLLDLPARRPRTASIPERRYLLSRAEGLPRNGLDESRRP